MSKKYWMTLVVLCSLLATVAAAQDAHAGHDMADGKSMKGMKHGSMGHMDMGSDSTGHADHMAAMHAKMEALHEHTMKMEGMSDHDALVVEMKKHMKMLDELVAGMMSKMMMEDEM